MEFSPGTTVIASQPASQASASTLFVVICCPFPCAAPISVMQLLQPATLSIYSCTVSINYHCLSMSFCHCQVNASLLSNEGFRCVAIMTNTKVSQCFEDEIYVWKYNSFFLLIFRLRQRLVLPRITLKCILQGGPNMAHFLYPLTSSNIDRFQNPLQEITFKAITFSKVKQQFAL